MLVPEALILEVLSPKAIETRIASPEALIIQILSPSKIHFISTLTFILDTLAPKLWSPEAVGLVVLSPSFLSPRFKSGEKLMVQILSPNILGGGSSEESKEHEGHEGHGEHGNGLKEHDEECCLEGSGEHIDQGNYNVQPTWHLKQQTHEKDLYSMRDWENQ